jgi:hypothetical protein
MTRHYSLWLAFVGTLLVAAWCLPGIASSADDKTKTTEPAAEKEKPHDKKIAMKTFMRKKLEASQSVLEGLAVEDFDLIERGARQLKTTGAAAEFMVINDPIYAGHADDFRKVIDRLAKAAKDRNLDGSTLAYVDMTMSCVECHKYTRTVLVAL